MTILHTKLGCPRSLVAILLLACLTTICLADTNNPNNGDVERSQSIESGEVISARAKFTLPRLFDFERYKKAFKKRYASLIENAARAKLFLGRAFRAFVSAISYKKRKTSYYLAINHMSDWTPEELSKISMRSQTIHDSLPDDEDEDLVADARVRSSHEDEPVPVASLDEVESALSDIVEHGDKEPVMRLLADEVRKRRDLAAAAERQISQKDIAREPAGHESAEVGQPVESNNPEYVPPELLKSGSSGYTQMDPLPAQAGQTLTGASGEQFISWVMGKMSNALKKSDNLEESPSLPDEMFTDHRGGCMFEPRYQGMCGSCYAFATTAIYEWLYCKATGKMVAFSEQYMVDCGYRNMLCGCNGGALEYVPEFVNKNGIELRANYPYRPTEDNCPYSGDVPDQARGYLRVSTSTLERVYYWQIEKKLKESPLLLRIHPGDTFHEYGGGVHDGADCEKSSHHAMVMVGMGREEGQDYWLLRNSYSVLYGEQGHYKLSTKAKHCIGRVYLLAGMTGLEEGEGVNKSYESSPIKQRLDEFMAAQKLESSKKNSSV